MQDIFNKITIKEYNTLYERMEYMKKIIISLIILCIIIFGIFVFRKEDKNEIRVITTQIPVNTATT